MKNLPKQGVTFRLANGGDLADLVLPGQGMRALSSSTGEINASGFKDLLQQQQALMTALASGQIVAVNEGQKTFASMSNAEKRDILQAAHADSQLWESLGATISEDVREQQTRQGFMSSLVMINELRQGEAPRVPMPRHDVQAVIATSPTQMGYQLIKDRYFFPQEFELKANVRVSELDLGQATHDLLDHAYGQALEAMVTGRDRIWKRAADMTVGVANNITLISGRLTPAVIGALRTQVTDWNLPATKALIANNFWEDIIAEPQWADALTPVAQYELVMTGKVGTLYGLELMTDGYRPENQRVLDRGDIYVVSDRENHGVLNVRGGITSRPTSGENVGETTKGWLLNEIMSFVLANPRSVAKAKR